jgi:hypothetical protein
VRVLFYLKKLKDSSGQSALQIKEKERSDNGFFIRKPNDENTTFLRQ